MFLWLSAPLTGAAALALLVGAAPAIGFLIARNNDGPRLRLGLLIGWAAAGTWRRP